MFDIMKLGKNISARRKALGMTQMELADKLGISYQAVSNWERGQTAPDISKLGEIAEILDCSIDELLGSQRTAEVIKQVEEQVENPDITPAELADVAPILKPDQVDKAFGSVFSKLSNLGETISSKINDAMSGISVDGKTISDRVNAALGDKLDEIHEKINSIDPEKIHFETHNIGKDGMAFTVIANSEEEWKEFRAYLDGIQGLGSDERRDLERLAKRYSIESVRSKLDEKSGDYGDEFDEHIEDVIEELEEELEEEREDERADRYAERAERKAERAERKAERAVERAERQAERAERRAERRSGRWFGNTIVFDDDHPMSNLEALARLAPFLPTETLNKKLTELADDENADASILAAFAPHADDDVVSEVALKLFERSGDLNDVIALAPFMDEDVIDELALKALERTDDFGSIGGLAPFISSETLAQLARSGYERTSDIGSLTAIAPFMDSDDLGEIAKQSARDGKSIGSLAGIAPFLDSDDVGEIAKSMVANGEKIGSLAAIAPFMDSDDLGEIARSMVANGESIGSLAAIAPFLDEDDLGEIAMAALDSGASFNELQSIMPFLGGFSEELWTRAASAPKAPTPPKPPVPPAPPKPEKSQRQADEELIQSLVTLLRSSGEDAINPLRNVVDPKILGEAIRRWEQQK